MQWPVTERGRHHQKLRRIADQRLPPLRLMLFSLPYLRTRQRALAIDWTHHEQQRRHQPGKLQSKNN